ncbi:hypothetical protein M0811_05868 [Anaeramoeba ignava]|uniref:Uncharacterized protein n=1 Tax=Anaeramoeba ignava TaxID=1746090 RepID=A0A9Q0LPI8_ANAIG|nr:hypothetical protein M0811_05868 [Anaeramoeba ignava]
MSLSVSNNEKQTEIQMKEMQIKNDSLSEMKSQMKKLLIKKNEREQSIRDWFYGNIQNLKNIYEAEVIVAYEKYNSSVDHAKSKFSNFFDQQNKHSIQKSKKKQQNLEKLKKQVENTKEIQFPSVIDSNTKEKPFLSQEEIAKDLKMIQGQYHKSKIQTNPISHQSTNYSDFITQKNPKLNPQNQKEEKKVWIENNSLMYHGTKFSCDLAVYIQRSNDELKWYGVIKKITNDKIMVLLMNKTLREFSVEDFQKNDFLITMAG